jgi:hypothetical protein
MSEELESRFGNVARGRAVSVTFEPKDFILALDYKVSFRAETNTFDVVLRRGGCFEGAYRCIERWIEAKAEELDGINGVPAGHSDCRSEMAYWGLEKIYDQFRSDLDSAIAERVSWLELVRPGEGALGDVTIEARARSLVGFLANLERADAEVRRGVLSPETIQLLKTIGLDVFPEAG